MEGRILERYRHPVLFYLLSTLIPWVMWFMAGYVSHIEPRNYFYIIIQSTLGILGLLSHVIIAFFLIYPDPVLSWNLKVRMFKLNEIKWFYEMSTIIMMFTSI